MKRTKKEWGLIIALTLISWTIVRTIFVSVRPVVEKIFFYFFGNYYMAYVFETFFYIALMFGVTYCVVILYFKIIGDKI